MAWSRPVGAAPSLRQARDVSGPRKWRRGAECRLRGTRVNGDSELSDQRTGPGIGLCQGDQVVYDELKPLLRAFGLEQLLIQLLLQSLAFRALIHDATEVPSQEEENADSHNRDRQKGTESGM